MLVIGSYRSEDNCIIRWGRGSGDHVWLLKCYRLKVQGCHIKNQIYVVMEAKWLAVLRPRCEGPGPHFLEGGRATASPQHREGAQINKIYIKLLFL